MEDRLIDFAASIVSVSTEIAETPFGRHLALQRMRSGTAPAPNYAEAGAPRVEPTFFINWELFKKELNETSVWLRILLKTVAEKPENIVAILGENQELCRIIGASIRTARAGVQAKRNPANEVSRSADNN